MSTFKKELEELINKHSKENGCDTPDFILANFLNASLDAFDAAVKHRSEWYGEGNPNPKVNIEEYHKLKAIADILSRVFYYGDFVIETPNERTIAGLLNELGLFPCTEDEIIKRPDYEEYFKQFRDYKLP